MGIGKITNLVNVVVFVLNESYVLGGDSNGKC